MIRSTQKTIIAVLALALAAPCWANDAVVRVGLVKPRVETSVGDGGQVSDTVRNTFAEFIGGPSQQVVMISARSPSQAMEEARLANCDCSPPPSPPPRCSRKSRKPKRRRTARTC